MAAVGQLGERVGAFAARKDALLARLPAADATGELARDAHRLRAQTAAIDHAVEAAREAAVMAASRSEFGEDPGVTPP